MQIFSTLPPNNPHLVQPKTSTFNCNGSPFDPSIKSQHSQLFTQTELTRTHLSNLEKLLQKEPTQPNTRDVRQVDSPPNNTSPKNRVNNLFGLNLAQIWHKTTPADEMSPCHLNRLRRLLSKSAEYSPRNSLGRRWPEYHGSNDWSGLLDPLDENLRREIVRYGEFIQAAYKCFHSNPATSAEAATFPRQVALPDRSYRVTRSLFSTSSIGLPSWVDDVAPDLDWMTQRSSWIGYVAVCEDKREIQRMGRRDIVIALRGTATCLEWGENMRDLLVKIPGQNDPTHGQPKVECGFLSLYKTRGAHMPSLAESVVEEVRRLIDLYKGETLSVTVTGHSLGAALALLVADELSTCSPKPPPVAVFSFGGPRVGNRDFANRMRAKNVKVLRIVNSQDMITRVPGMFVSEELDEKLRNTGAASVLKVFDKMPWAYSHVGTELRVDTKMSPYLKPNADVACCHDLEAYLHLVDGFLASNCPFRANAKRSLLRLLNEQKSNVKKLYTSKAKALRLNIERERENVHMSSCLPSPS